MQDLDQHIAVLKRHGYEQDEALILLMRLQLIKIIQAEISRRKWSQRDAAKILGVAQTASCRDFSNGYREVFGGDFGQVPSPVRTESSAYNQSRQALCTTKADQKEGQGLRLKRTSLCRHCFIFSK